LCKYGISVIKWRKKWIGHISLIADRRSIFSTMVRKPEERIVFGIQA
jgi:hypothetical protein